MLTRDDIVMVLGELADDLEARGIHGDLFLVGGAAMARAHYLLHEMFPAGDEA